MNWLHSSPYCTNHHISDGFVPIRAECSSYSTHELRLSHSKNPVFSCPSKTLRWISRLQWTQKWATHFLLFFSSGPRLWVPAKVHEELPNCIRNGFSSAPRRRHAESRAKILLSRGSPNSEHTSQVMIIMGECKNSLDLEDKAKNGGHGVTSKFLN